MILLINKEKIFILLMLTFTFLNLIDYIVNIILGIFLIKFLPYAVMFLLIIYAFINIKRLDINLVALLIIFILFSLFMSVWSVVFNDYYYVLNNIKDKIVPYILALTLSLFNITKLRVYFIKYFPFIIYCFVLFQIIDILNFYFYFYNLDEYFSYVNKQDELNSLSRSFLDFIFPRANGLSGNLHLTSIILSYSFIYSLFYLPKFISTVLFLELFLSFSLQFIGISFIVLFGYILMINKSKSFKLLLMLMMFVIGIVISIVVIGHFSSGDGYTYASSFEVFREFSLEHIIGVGSLIANLPSKEATYNPLLLENALYLTDNAFLAYIFTSGLYVFCFWLCLHVYLIIKLYQLRFFDKFIQFLFLANILILLSYLHYVTILNKSVVYIYAFILIQSFYVIKRKKYELY